jgi:hypothetical protein
MVNEQKLRETAYNSAKIRLVDCVPGSVTVIYAIESIKISGDK